MNTPTLLFTLYLLIGLVLMIVAVASPGREKRARRFGTLGTGDGFDAGVLIFVALFWPVWLLVMLLRRGRLF
ncbi:MAG: hypothetical protein JNN01_23465 [Opitutaceae bacterium]|nr:hypothetical protein [Opitutaceae bacterium]